MTEILVSVAVMCIVGALLAPVLSRVMEKSKTAGAMSNMRQIYLGLLGYEQDHGKLPPLTATVVGGPSGQEPFWNQRIIPYLEADFQTPEGDTDLLMPKVFYDPAAKPHNRRRGDFGALFEATYGPFRGADSGSLAMAQIAHPAKTILLGTAEQEGAMGSYYFQASFNQNSAALPRLSERHQKMALVGFADGSIRQANKATLYKEEILPFRNK